MSFWDFLGFKKKKNGDETQIILSDLKTRFEITDLAYEICVQRIAKAICKCEFRTYKKGEEIKEAAYYRLNVRPNPNQTATEFWQAVVERLYDEMEVLLVSDDRCNLYLADGYNIKNENDPTRPLVFKDVSVGGKKLSGSYKAGEVAYLKMSNQQIKRLLKQTLEIYSELVDFATKTYKNGTGMKTKLHIGTSARAKDEKSRAALKNTMKNFFDSPNACYLEYDGYQLDILGTGKSQESSRDIKAMLDDVLEMTSRAFLIPVNIANGEVTDTSKAVDDFLTFCLDAVISLLEDGLNNALFSEKDYLKGTMVRINASTIKHVDLLDASGAIDKLISCGAMSVNDVRRIIGDEPISEEWANTHWITKNYTNIDTLQNLEPEKGGNLNEDENAQLPPGSETGV